MPITKKFIETLSDKAKVFLKDEVKEKDYKVQTYQYGTTSHVDGDMKPAAVIYPGDLDDIKLLVKEAAENDFGIAVRSGGHQYSGASSTHGDNVLLDTSDVFEDFTYPSDEDSELAKIGVSMSLDQMNLKMRENQIFLPHGQCLHVHLGGHVQTGGYGQLSRSFGLLSDHIEGFKIVLADATDLQVWSPTRKEIDSFSADAKKRNDDLYWAVLGGSPGNFGILTHVWVRPHKDGDHPDSRGLRDFCFYTKERLEKVLAVIAEMNDKKDLARDFDICCTVMSDANHCGFLEMLEARSKGKKPLKGKEEPDPDYLDEYMRSKHKDEYADGVDGLDTSGKPGLMLPVILVYLQWANVDKNAKFGDNDEADWFKKVKAALLTPVSDADKQTEVYFNAFKQKRAGEEWQFVDETQQKAMSELTRYWCYKNIREFVQPYEKRVYVTERKNLSKKDDVLKKTWPEWATGRIDEIMVDGNEEMNIVVQIQPFGGDNSMFNKNGDPSDQTTHGNHGCHSWRQDISLVQVLDYFYRPADKDAILHPGKDEHLKIGLEWQAENDKTAGTDQAGNKGFFSEFDRRLLWGSYARLTDPDDGTSLDSLHKCYFDTDKKYEDLVKIKKDVDKDHIFTPNSFAVGAKDAPDKRNLPIRGRGHKAFREAAKEAEKASGKKQ